MERNKVAIPYGMAVLGVGLATCIAYGWPALREIHSLAPYMIAVVIAAFYGGLWPSLFSIVLSVAAFSYFIAPPRGFAMSEPQDQFRVLQFVFVAGFISALHAQRVKADAKSRSMTQRLSLALEATQLGVWDLNLNTGAMWHSDSLEELYGRSRDRFAPAYEGFLGYVHTEDRDFVHRAVTRSIEGGKGFNIQFRIVLPAGQQRWVGTRGHIFFDDKGRPERLVAVATDITDRPVYLAPPSSVVTRSESRSADMEPQVSVAH